jgi:hypothetical protein
MVDEQTLKAQDAMIDELLDGLKEEGHKLLRKAYDSGAINSEDYTEPGSYIMAKMIVTILENQHHYYPLSPQVKKEMKNLEKFI